jgi:hypothetical protein
MEGAIKNEQSRETDNIGYTRRRQKKTKTPDTICVGHHYAQKTYKTSIGLPRNNWR